MIQKLDQSPVKKPSLAIVYEITDNPALNSNQERALDRLSEFANPGEINQLVRTLKNLGYEISIVDGSRSLIEDIELIKKREDLVFNKSLGFKGLERKIAVPAICQLFDVPYIGTSAYAMTLARHKYHTSRLVHGMGIRTPMASIYKSEWVDISHFQFPVIVKPNQESDAIGIDEGSVCSNEREAQKRAIWITNEYFQPAIIEEFVSGEEWKVAVLGNGKNANSAGIAGVMKNGRPMDGSLQTRQDVIMHKLDYYRPKESKLTKKANAIAVQLHQILELRDYSRTDFRIGKDGELYCMEVSTHPDLSEDSSFIYAAMHSFPNFSQIIEMIVDSAISRINRPKTGGL